MEYNSSSSYFITIFTCQGSAVVLFLFSLAHAIIVLFFINHTPSHTYRKSSIILKKIGLIGMILALVGSVIFHPASNLADTHVISLQFEIIIQSHTMFNLAGIAQWIFVASMISFFSSYTIDFKSKVEQNVCFISHENLIEQR